jgi:hypothetical protein
MQVAGFDFSTAVKGFGIRGEVSYTIPRNILFDDTYLQYVIGVDYTLSNILGNNNLFMLVQWIHELSENNTDYPWYDLNHVFQKTLMSRFELDLGYNGKLILQYFNNIYNHDQYIQPKLEYKLSDNIKATLLLDLLYGKDNSFFGNYSNNKRIQVKLNYNF